MPGDLRGEVVVWLVQGGVTDYVMIEAGHYTLYNVRSLVDPEVGEHKEMPHSG